MNSNLHILVIKQHSRAPKQGPVLYVDDRLKPNRLIISPTRTPPLWPLLSRLNDDDLSEKFGKFGKYHSRVGGESGICRIMDLHFARVTVPVNEQRCSEFQAISETR